MANIETRVSQDGETSYRVKVRIKGHPVVTETFKRLTDAKKWASQTETEIRQGRYFKTSEAQKHTLADVLERYIRDVLPHRKSDQKKVEMHLNFWKSKLGAYFLADITPPVLAEYRDKLASEIVEGKKKSPATVNRYIASLSVTLSASVEWGWLDENPLTKVKKMKEPRGRVRFLSKEETTALLDCCKDSKSPHLYNIVVLALATGARKGEILSLKWENIDLKRRMMNLEYTKNGERRPIPLTGHAWERIQIMWHDRKLGVHFVFPSADGKGPADFRDAWDLAIKKSKINNFRFHDLRHTAASNLAMNGASLLEIAQILGHKTLAMVQRYAHLTEQHTATVLSRMNEKQFECMALKGASLYTKPS